MLFQYLGLSIYHILIQINFSFSGGSLVPNCSTDWDKIPSDDNSQLIPNAMEPTSGLTKFKRKVKDYELFLNYKLYLKRKLWYVYKLIYSYIVKQTANVNYAALKEIYFLIQVEDTLEHTTTKVCSLWMSISKWYTKIVMP